MKTLKEKVIEILKLNLIDITKLRIITHGKFIDIYPKNPQYNYILNNRKSTRVDKTRAIKKKGIYTLTPVIKGKHYIKISKCYAMIDEEMIEDNEAIEYMCYYIKLNIK